MFSLSLGLDEKRERWCLAACVLLAVFYAGTLAVLQSASIRVDTVFFAQRRQVQLRRLLQFRLPLGSPIALSQHGHIVPFFALSQGWSIAEPWGVWTDGAQADLAVALPQPLPPSPVLQLWAVIAQPSEGGQIFRLHADGRSIGEWRPKHAQAIFCVPLPSGSVSGSGLLQMRIDIGLPQQPPGGLDHRKLGLGLARMEALSGTAGCEKQAELPVQ